MRRRAETMAAMSQAEADSDHGGTKHDLLLRVGASLNAHRRWLVAITGGLLPGVAAVLSVVGQELQDIGDWAYVGSAGMAIVASALLQLLSGWAAEQTAEIDLREADRLRVTLKDALQPVAEMIADMELLSRHSDRVAALRNVATQAVGGLHLIFADIDRARSTVYRLTEDGDMDCVSYFGRGEGVQPQPFLRYTQRGEQVLAMVRAGEEMLIPDVDAVEINSDGKVVSPDYRGSRSGYKTFISCSITNRDKRYGMVTPDAPVPRCLSDTDKHLVGLMADLLAVAFAIEERAARTTKRDRGRSWHRDRITPPSWQTRQKG
jgi:hypothetical protein